ncbi:uncharacterized protein TNCV_173051 [Trichonephila clavipes]|nr:uncharacterized protein TNCV_173051 [Trichonephila clavipes]
MDSQKEMHEQQKHCIAKVPTEKYTRPPDYYKFVSQFMTVFFEDVISRRKQRSAFDRVSEFDRGRIVAYRECGLSFRKIGSRVGQNQTAVIRICDRWMQEGTTDRRGRSHPPQCTTLREDRQIVRMAVTDLSVTSRTVAQHIESVTHHCVCAYHSTSFTAEWSVRKTSIDWSTLDAEPQTSPPPMVP